jgi:hypothetical protein
MLYYVYTFISKAIFLTKGAINMAKSKKDLTELIHQLSDKDVPLVADFLKRLITHPLDAHIPYDDEPLTEDDLKAISKADLEVKQGLTIKLRDIEHELRN